MFAFKNKSLLTYYPELDGLRSVAVILVVLYHLGLPLLKGGFVGVDIFFVISGYLITLLLLHEFQTGNISLLSFYVRRVKRIMPALITVMLFSAVVAYAVFSPADLKRFNQAYLFSITGVSNIYLWLESGYFDISNQLKPDLHTWSLSVELQYYLAWPILFIFIVKRYHRYTALIVFLIALFSLTANLFVLSTSSIAEHILPRFILEHRASTIFYLLPFRIFEFSLGALVALFKEIRNKSISNFASDCVVLAGLILLAISAIYIDSSFSFPSLTALLPCAGAALIILAADNSWVGRTVLGNSVSILVGSLSYSIYLVHWPLLVFFRHANIDTSHISFYTTYFFCLVALSYMLHKLVEVPIRRIRLFDVRLTPHPKLLIVTLTFSIAVVLLPFATNYLPQLQNNKRTVFTELERQTAIYDSKIMARDPSCSFQDFSIFNPSKCIKPSSGKINILVLGDSVSSRIWSGLRALLPNRFELLQLSPSNCRPGLEWGTGYCKESNDFIFNYLKTTRYDLVVLASLGPDLVNFKKTLQFLNELHQPSVAIGLPPIFKERLPDFVFKHLSSNPNLDEIRYIANNGLIDDFIMAHNDLQQTVHESHVPYYDIAQTFCTNIYLTQSCDYIVNNNSFITGDNNHLTQAAAEKALQRLSDIIIKSEEIRSDEIDFAALRNQINVQASLSMPHISASSQLEKYSPAGLLLGTQPGWHASQPTLYPVIVSFDFRTLVSVGEISLLAQDNNEDRAPRTIRIEASTNGLNWQEVGVITNICRNYKGHWVDFDLSTKTSARIFRLVIEKNCGNPSLLTLRGVRFK